MKPDVFSLTATLLTATLATLPVPGIAPGMARAQEAVSPDTAEQTLADLARARRDAAAALDFEAFKAQTTYLPETGKYYVNGDTPIRNEKLLREFWESAIRAEPADEGTSAETPEFIIHNVGGLDQFWDADTRMHLTYCVSTAFGPRHAAVSAAMADAAAAWEAVAALDFIHVAAHDADCGPGTDAVLFDVRPVDAGGQFLAAAFFPNEPRAGRNVVIDPSSFGLDPNGALTLTGILRHELGHVIGARHEHTRPDSGACFEDTNWTAVTDYDAFSVMHYPQCNGLGDWTLRLTETDKSGVACVYGAAAGFAIDPDICTPRPGATPAPASTTQAFGPFEVAQGDMVQIGVFPVQPGTPFAAVMTGAGPDAGDPDLYVKFDGAAAIANYDCRPFSLGAEEECGFDVPAGAAMAFVAVHGYAAGHFSVSVTSTPPVSD